MFDFYWHSLLNFLRKPFLVCWKRHTPLVHKIWVREFFSIFLHYKYPKKLYTSKTGY
jgi:hypothetical protein